jgi:hypothetical protein
MEHEYYLGSLNFKSNIRLLVLHPISPGNGNEGPFHLPEYDYLLKTTAVDEVYCAGAPRAIQGPADSEKAVPFIVEKARWAESQGYDAIIINCMLDPGVTATKNSVSIPVVGVREATRAIASLVGKSPAHIYPQNIPVLDLSRDEEKTVSELVNMGRKQISEMVQMLLFRIAVTLAALHSDYRRSLGCLCWQTSILRYGWENFLPFLMCGQNQRMLPRKMPQNLLIRKRMLVLYSEEA